MFERDRLWRASARIRAIKDNVPGGFEVSESWVSEFHDALTGLEGQLTMDVDEFRVPHSELRRSVSSGNYLTGEVRYREGLWCQRSVLMQKVDAVLYYLNDLYGETNR